MTIALDPGTLTLHHAVDAPTLALTFGFDFVPSRVEWRVIASQGNAVIGVGSLVWTP